MTKEYQSGDLPITMNGNISLTHGLGVPPKIIEMELKCVTSQANFAVGDTCRVMDYMFYSATRYGVMYAANDSGIKLMIGTILTVFDKSTGAHVDIVPANWRLVVRAWA